MAAPKRTTGGGIVKQVITHVVNPENLMRAWEIANKDDRVVEFVRNVHLPRNLKPLEQRGLICDTACKGRSRSLELTSTGKEVLARARVYWQQAQDEMTEALGPEMIEQFFRLVDHILQL